MSFAFAQDRRRSTPSATSTVVRLIALGVATTLVAGAVQLALVHYLRIT